MGGLALRFLWYRPVGAELSFVLALSWRDWERGCCWGSVCDFPRFWNLGVVGGVVGGA